MSRFLHIIFYTTGVTSGTGTTYLWLIVME